MLNQRTLVSIISITAMSAGLTTVALAQGPSLVWTDKDAVQVWRSEPDGSHPTVLYDFADGLRDPRGIAVDPASGQMYLADSGTGTIYLGSILGESPLTPLYTGQNGPADLILDNGTLVWASQGGNQIVRGRVDGTEMQTVISGLNEPYYLAVDSTDNWLYWSDFNSGTIHRARLDGTTPTNFITGLSRVRDVEIDRANGKIYWADRNRPDIRRQNLDGTQMEVLFSAADGLGRPHGLWLDPQNELIYWTDTTTGDVLRGDLNGIGAPQILFDGPTSNGPWELQLVVPEPMGLSLPTTLSWLLLCGCRIVRCQSIGPSRLKPTYKSGKRDQ